MKHTLLIVLVLSTILPVMSEARTWHVEPDSTGQVINIQAGIDSAAAGDTVLAASGYYFGDGNWDLDFKGKSIVVLSDGGAFIVSSENYVSLLLNVDYGQFADFPLDAHDIYETLIVALDLIDADQMPLADDHFGFHFHSGEDTESVVEGFGLLFLNPSIIIEDSSPKIINNHLVSCCVDYAIRCDNSDATIANNMITNQMGTEILCRNSRSLIKDNRFSSDGRKIYCDSDSSIIINNTTTGVSSGAMGPQIYCQDSYNIIKGNEIGGGDYGMIGIQCLRGLYEISDNRIRGATGANGIVCDSCNTVVSNNHVDICEIGLNLNGGSHMIYGNTIINNLASWGGGYGRGISFTYIDSTTVCTGNFVYSNGEGIGCDHASPIISDNVIVFNRYNMSSGGGGGIRCKHSSPLIIRNTIAYNWAERGAGISCLQSSPRIENCIIAYNSYCNSPSAPFGYGIYCEDELSVPAIINCNVYGNTGGNYVGILDQTGINGNFSLAPLFCDPDNHEFTLHALSPCLPENNPYGPDCGLIGALGMGCDFIATLLQSFNAEYDNSFIEINWTLFNPVDISDFEIYRASAPEWEFRAVNDPELDSSGTSFTYLDRDISPGTAYKYRVLIFDESAARILFETDRVDVPAVPLALNQNYPNPFNPSTRITYYLPEDDRVSLDVYDVSGRLVVRLIDDYQGSGNHSVDWNGTNSNGSDVSSGTYFYRLTSGKDIISRKMVLLK